MFPDFRLLVGAMCASVVALSCGFGIFAAFRVNHEPLSRLPADTVALQLVTSEAAGPHPVWGAPFGSHFNASGSVSEPRGGGMTVAPTPIPIRNASLELASRESHPEAATDTSLTPDASQQAALPPHAAQPATPSTAAVPTEPPAPIASTNDAPRPSAPIADTPAPAIASPSTATSLAQQTSAAATPSAQPTADAKGDGLGETGEPAIPPVPAVAAIEAPSPVSLDTPSAEITAAPEKAAPTAVPPKHTGKYHRATRRKSVRKPAERRRVVVRRRIIRKPRPRAATQFGYQNSDFRNPVFQTAPSAFQRQPATSRGSEKRTSENTPGNNFSLDRLNAK